VTTTTTAAALPSSEGGPRVRFAPGAEELRSHLASILARGADSRPLKDNAVRTVFSAAAPPPFRGVVVKLYKRPDAATRLKQAIVGRPYDREWRGLERVAAAGIAAPRALAIGESGGRPFLVTEEIANARTASALLRETRDRSERREILDGLARIAAALVRARLFHRDLHTGNFLRGDDGVLRVLDLHTLLRVPAVLRDFAAGRSLARLVQSLLELATRTERMRFVRAFAAAAGAADAARRLYFAAERDARSLEWRRIKSRTRRCVLKSTEFWVERLEGARLFYRRSFGSEAALAAVRAHERADGPLVLKNGRRTKVTRVEAGGKAVCVKEHRVRGLRDRARNLVWRGRARNEWMAGHALEVLKLDTPRTLALLEGKGRRSSYVVTELKPALRELDRSIHEEWAPGTPPSRRRPLIRLAAALVATLHARRLYHNDLKAKNLLLGRRADGAPALWIIDLTGVRVGRRFTERRRRKNLAQLDTSLPPEATAADRMRFLALYLRLLRSREDRRALARAVRRAGAGRVNYWKAGRDPLTSS